MASKKELQQILSQYFGEVWIIPQLLLCEVTRMDFQAEWHDRQSIGEGAELQGYGI